MEDSTRATLLHRVKDPKDASAWNEFDHLYRPMMKRFAATCRMRTEDADDLVQQCMLEVHKHIRSFDYDPNRGRYRNWLRTMFNNRYRSLLRRRKAVQASTTVLRKVVGSEPLPEEDFERIWMSEHVRLALEKLRQTVDKKIFEAYERYAIQEESTAEVCEAYGLTPEQLHTLRYRMNKKLKKTLTELIGEDAE